jgi:tRNA threonylcarbamoyladenosine biosynthesis protein TsaE
MTRLDPRSFEASSSSEDQTLRLGARLGVLLPKRCIITLHGGLGAGKTAFSRGVGEGWGAEPMLRSPTFTLIQRHTRPADRAALYHVDLYRVESAADLASTGLRELLDEEDAIFLIEWPERIEALISDDAIQINIRSITDTKRHLLFSTKSDDTWKTLIAYRKAAFGV